jgi:hypothetical protein
MAASSATPEVLVVENPDKDSRPMFVSVRANVDCELTETEGAVLAGVTDAPLTIVLPPEFVTASSGCGSVKAMQRLLVTDGSAGLVGTQTSFA